MTIRRGLNDTGSDRSGAGIDLPHAKISYRLQFQRFRYLPCCASAIRQHAMRHGVGVERMKHGSGGKRGYTIEQNRHLLRASSQYRPGKGGDLTPAKPTHCFKRVGKMS